MTSLTAPRDRTTPRSARRPRNVAKRRYLSLVFYKTYAELRAETSRTYAGFLWWVVEPVISMAVYYIVFEVFLHRGTSDFVLFLFVGLVPWRWLQATTSHGASAIMSARSLMQQVYVPKVVFPISSILSDTVKFAVVFLLLLVGIALWQGGLPFSALALPVVVAVEAALITALTLLLAAVTPFLPDVRLLLESFLRLWLFVSGVFYPIEALPERFQAYLRFNPMAVVLDAYRDVLLAGVWPSFYPLLCWGTASLVACWLACRLLRRLDFVYPKLEP